MTLDWRPIAALFSAIAVFAFMPPAEAQSALECSDQLPDLCWVDDGHLRPPATRPLGLAAGPQQLTCFGDGKSGPRVQVIHLTEKGRRTKTQISDLMPGVLAAAQTVEESSRAHGGPIKSIRFVHDSQCVPVIERVEAPSDVFWNGYSATVEWLIGRGYVRADRKYLILVDEAPQNVCGLGSATGDASPGPDNAANVTAGWAYVTKTCWGYAEAHELFHTFGAVHVDAPHATGWGHCTDEWDLMCYDDEDPKTRPVVVCGMEWETLLDCGGDDYFNPKPKPGSWLDKHWNTYDSVFLGLVSEGHKPSGPTFFDVWPDNPFRADIAALAAAGITRGCGPNAYCPDEPVTRGQMAAFLGRALGLEAGKASFVDMRGHVFEADVAALADAGITRGCDPPRNTRFCPEDVVTRGQMAAFLVRALGLEGGGAAFTDTAESVFARDIAALASSGITRGCNPPHNDRYCPDEPVTRGQMAAFLVRAGLAG